MLLRYVKNIIKISKTSLTSSLNKSWRTAESKKKQKRFKLFQNKSYKTAIKSALTNMKWNSQNKGNLREVETCLAFYDS